MGLFEQIAELFYGDAEKPDGTKRRDKVPKPEEYEQGRIYDYETPEGRVATAEWLFQQAKDERVAKENEWIRHNDYYNFRHEALLEMTDALVEMNIPWTPAVVPDCFVQVESQIVPDVPEPEFKGRDDDMDSKMAKERELGVRYMLEANRVNDMNTANERRLRKLGDAFWKCYWDETMNMGRYRGDVRIKDVTAEDIYPDPTVGNEGLQAGEYMDYVYTMHKLKFWRIFHKDLERLGKTLEEVVGQQYRFEDGILEPFTKGSQSRDDMVQILEHWFRQPEDKVIDGQEVPAGAVACTIQAGGVELRYIPHYWKRTNCGLFPFVHYWCIRDETGFWNKSELESIIPMVDAADRELAFAQLNDAMTAADMILVEEDALVPGCEITNRPGATIEVKKGRAGGIARLGGLNSGGHMLKTVSWMLEQIQRTNRNYDTNTGKESARITTASGLLQLRSDAESQQRLKKADRNRGFERMYELLDQLALEFFDEDRMLIIGAKEKSKEPETLVYNSHNYEKKIPAVRDPATDEEVCPERTYFPRVDVTVTAGDGLSRNPATTVQVLDKLAATQVTEENWKLLAAELEYLDIPQKQAIVEEWRRKFEPIVPPELIGELENNPVLLELVGEMVLTAMDVDGEEAAGAGVPAAGQMPEAAAGGMPTPPPAQVPPPRTGGIGTDIMEMPVM